MEKKSTIKLPLESYGKGTTVDPTHTTDYCKIIGDIIKHENENKYFAKYAIGISFGANLSKWRKILDKIFPYSDNNNNIIYNNVKKFEYATLLSDPIYIDDNDSLSQKLSDNLDIRLYRREEYLHTKLILVYLENSEERYKYILFVSSKNISNSSNFDILVPLYSISEDDEDNRIFKEYHGNERIQSGIKLQEYIKYLFDNTESVNKEKAEEILKKCEENLGNIEFDVKNEQDDFPGKITDFMISYNKDNRFSEELWNEIENAQLIISPYISEEIWNKIMKTNSFKKILSYKKTWKKLNNNKDCDKLNNLYTGKLVDGKGRYKFHAKMYVSSKEESEKKYTQIYFGSANLTKEAKEKHFEILIGIKFTDDNKIYNYIHGTFLKNNNCVAALDSDIIEEEYDIDDEGGELPNRMDRYAFYKDKEKDKYKLRIVGLSDNIKKEIIFDKKNISHWIMIEDNGYQNQIYICKDNYYKDEDNKDPNYIEYDEFIKCAQLDERSIKKIKDELYDSIFFKKNKSLKQKKNGEILDYSLSDQTMSRTEYGCLFKVIQNDETINKENISNILKQILKVYMDEDNDGQNEKVKLMKEYVRVLK